MCSLGNAKPYPPESGNRRTGQPATRGAEKFKRRLVKQPIIQVGGADFSEDQIIVAATSVHPVRRSARVGPEPMPQTHLADPDSGDYRRWRIRHSKVQFF